MEIQKPTVGRIVLVVAPGNDLPDAPAIITYVHSASCINATIFPDRAEPLQRTSLLEGTAPGNWYWPPRS